MIDGVFYKTHQIIFLLEHGFIPSGIDHINGIKDDNRIVNLRECNQSQNNMNKRRQKNNTSGVVGVYWNKKLMKWQAEIVENKVRHYLGLFTSKEEAMVATNTARINLHKEFAFIHDQTKSDVIYHQDFNPQ